MSEIEKLAILIPDAIEFQESVVLRGIPKGIYVEYFGRLADGTKFVICRPEKNWSYSDFVCLMGATSLKPIPVIKTTRYRDGGTTDVAISSGTFHFPTPFRKEEKATFCGEEITVYDRQPQSKEIA